jgi:hypothetical protein
MKMTKVKVNKEKNAFKTMDFSELKTVYSDTDCNELILKGWEILHVGVSHVDNNGYSAKTTYMMANPRTSK